MYLTPTVHVARLIGKTRTVSGAPQPSFQFSTSTFKTPSMHVTRGQERGNDGHAARFSDVEWFHPSRNHTDPFHLRCPSSEPVPPQNVVDRTIVDVYALGVELAYSCCGRRHFHDPCSQLRHPREQRSHRLARLRSAIEKARPKPDSLMAVTPTMRSWNQFSAFIEEWDELRMAA